MPGGIIPNMRVWDADEDDFILNWFEAVGPKWQRIAERLPGRSAASIRNRFQRIQKGRKAKEAGVMKRPNLCALCRVPRRGHICYAKQTLKVDSPPFVDLSGEHPEEGGSASEGDADLERIERTPGTPETEEVRTPVVLSPRIDPSRAADEPWKPPPALRLSSSMFELFGLREGMDDDAERPVLAEIQFQDFEVPAVSKSFTNLLLEWVGSEIA